jgi:C_GCAxxG_C_C family probable redox protein
MYERRCHVNRKEIEKKAFWHFQSGFNCAEAILKTFVETVRKKPYLGITKFASGFGGGIGGSHCDACGALTGGVIAIGWLFGRKHPDDDRSTVFSLSAEFRDQFLARFGATDCKTILASLGDQENALKCKKLTAEAAGILFALLGQGTRMKTI